MATAASKKETVSIRTFNKWSFCDEFEILKTDEGNITTLKCKICSDNLANILNEARRRSMKGVIISGIMKLAEGVECVHKGNLFRHIKSGGLHDWAKQRFGSCSSSTPSRPSVSTSSGTSGSSDSGIQPRIDVVINSTTRTQYRHLFNTALFIAREEKPFSEFPHLIELQKRNGVQFLAGKDSDKCCREFVSCLSAVMRNNIKMMLGRANFFSGMMDGSQARKTGSEKELVYAKVVVNGSPTELLLKCQDMSEIGGEDAHCVKMAYDKTFVDTYSMPEETRYAKLMVSVCTDGASVNLGVHNGACTQIKNDHERGWLLVIHCSNHRLELAIKDAFMSDKAFLEIDTTMMNIYYHFRNSGKAKRILIGIALTLGVTCVSFVKAHGTRFQNHKYRASKSMLINYLPLCMYCENMIETPGACKAEMASKLRGYLNLFLTYTYLASLHFYRQVLRITAHLSFVMQTSTAILTDIVDAISEAKVKLTELVESEADLPFDALVNEDDSICIDAKATNLPVTMAFKEKHQLTEKEKKRVEKLTQATSTTHCQQYTLKNVKQGKECVKRIKGKLLPAISNAIDKRFAPFLSESEIYNSVHIVDYSVWDFDDKMFGMDKIKNLSEHFQTPLEFHGYNMNKAIAEFKLLKAYVGQKYRNHTNKLQVWKSIFLHSGTKFPHILLLIELCLSLAWSSSTVERGFSVCSRTLADSRTSIKKDTLDDLLMLRVNLPTLEALEPGYVNSLVNAAVDMYLSSTSRRLRTGHRSSASVLAQGDHDGVGSRPGFLPTPFASSTHDLLEVEDYLFVSDSDEEIEEIHSDTTDHEDNDHDDIMDYDSATDCDMPELQPEFIIV